jgi:hypothetical protein
MTGGFLLAVIASVLAIVLVVPEYAEPAQGAASGEAGVAAAAVLGPSPSATPSLEPAPSPTSATPDELTGYRWPVRGGQVEQYYDWDSQGRFVITGRRVHGALLITWFAGAAVKAAHDGTVVAAGTDWQDAVGYDGPLDGYYERLRRKHRKPSLGVVIDDGNGYYSVYSELQDLRVAKGQEVAAGTLLGGMGRYEKRQMMRYHLVRMDGDWLRVSEAARRQGFPDYVREHVDPLVVLRLHANKKPRTDRPSPPGKPPRRSEY